MICETIDRWRQINQVSGSFGSDAFLFVIFFSLVGHHRNPQTELFLRFLELPYLLDNTSESNDPTQTLMPLIYGGIFLHVSGC